MIQASRQSCVSPSIAKGLEGHQGSQRCQPLNLALLIYVSLQLDKSAGDCTRAPRLDSAVACRSPEMLTPYRISSSSKAAGATRSHAKTAPEKPKMVWLVMGSQPASTRRRMPSTLLLAAATCNAGDSTPVSCTLAFALIRIWAASLWPHASASPRADVHGGIPSKGCAFRVVLEKSARNSNMVLITCGSPPKAA